MRNNVICDDKLIGNSHHRFKKTLPLTFTVMAKIFILYTYAQDDILKEKKFVFRKYFEIMKNSMHFFQTNLNKQ